ADGTVDLLLQLLVGHDLDVPAAELAGQTDVLPLAADRQRKLILAHEHDRPSDHVAKQYLIDFGGLQRGADQRLSVVVVAHDVDPLAGQFIDDVLDPIAADADAGPHAIDAGVATRHGDLAA